MSDESFLGINMFPGGILVDVVFTNLLDFIFSVIGLRLIQVGTSTPFSKT